jgi:lysophospholipase L1-like esterase
MNFSEGNFTIQRYPRGTRWTGILQNLLGENFHIVEEGLNSRTTNLNYQIPPDRNGKTYLQSCLYSHAPIDLVILALGGNDLKAYFNRTSSEIRAGLAELVEIIQGSFYGERMHQPPKILIMSPFKVLAVAEQFKDENGVVVLADAGIRAQELVQEYAALAKEKNCFFLDVSKSIYPSEIDGMHLDAAAHQELAKILSENIKSIFHE